MTLLTDLQNLADHLSPSDVATGERVVGALIKVLEHEGLKVPDMEELLPEEHPARVAPPAPAPAAPDASSSRLDRIEAMLERLTGHEPAPSEPGPAPAGSETPAPSSEPATPPAVVPPVTPEPSEPGPAPELDRP